MNEAPVQPLRHLGRLRLVTVGINSVIGGGIFILPATVAGLAGAASLWAYVAAGVVVLGVGTALGRLATRFEVSGGPYVYIRRTFGAFAGFQIGWLFCLARLTALANLLHGAAGYLGALLPVLAQPAPRAGLILLFATAVAAINIAGVRQTSSAAGLLALLKVTPLVLLGVAGLFLVDPARFVPAPVEPGSMVRAVLLLMFAFTGFETLTVPAEESLRPRTDMPRALLLTIATVCGVYLLVHAAALGALPGLSGESAPLASLAARLLGDAGRTGMTGIATLSMLGCSLISLFGASRMLYAMSAEGQIPAFFGALDPVRRTPVAASLLTGAVGAVLAILGGYVFLAAVSSGTRLLIYLACCLACLVPAAAGGAGRRLVPILTTAAIAGLLCKLERHEVLFGMIGIGFGIGLYLLSPAGRQRSRTAREAV